MRRLVRRPWFRDKTVGFGLSPGAWQGWALTGEYALAVLVTMGVTRAPLSVRAALAAAEILLFVVLAVATSTWLSGPGAPPSRGR
jgi:hypothetical protein